MKNPLRYQITEYDCGPTSLLNGLSYLFQREEIAPEAVRSVMLFCLDSFGADGDPGKNGTSHTAMQFLSHWLDGFGQTGRMALSSAYLSGRDVNLSQNGRLADALRRGGAAVVRTDLDGWHYILLTGLGEDCVLAFDPYREEGDVSPGVTQVGDRPGEYNRIIPIARMDSEELRPYAFGPAESREAVLLFNGRTVLTAEDTVEYMI